MMDFSENHEETVGKVKSAGLEAAAALQQGGPKALGAWMATKAQTTTDSETLYICLSAAVRLGTPFLPPASAMARILDEAQTLLTSDPEALQRMQEVYPRVATAVCMQTAMEAIRKATMYASVFSCDFTPDDTFWEGAMALATGTPLPSELKTPSSGTSTPPTLH